MSTAHTLSSLASPLALSDDRSSRLPVIVIVLFLHALAGWGLLQLDATRQVLAESGPLFVSWVASPELKPLETPKPPPKPVKRIEPAPLITATPKPDSPAPVFEAPPAPPEPAPILVAAPAPEVVAPPPPMQPKTIPASAVRFRHSVQPRYLPISKRIGEQGRVIVRVLIDTNGKAAQVQLRESSGFERLDREAIAAAQASLFHPHEENGQPIPVWALIPYEFTLE